MSARQQRPSRIPASLQAVFLASNRGSDVHAPPPERVAYKVFFRNWRFQAKSFSESATGLFRKNKPDSSKRCGSPTPVKKVEAKKPVPVEQPIAPAVKYHPLLKPKVVEANAASPSPRSPAPLAQSPQAFLDAMIRSRGYSTARYKSLQTAYYNKPTPLQNASYDLHLIGLVRRRDVAKFREIMGSGISPNPCNAFGESILHGVCRKGETEFVRIMLESGASVQVADDYGRTPLSDACWAPRPCFDVVMLLLDRDPRLFHLTDCRGAVPLSYVPEKDWPAWISFLDSVKDRYWPPRDGEGSLEEQKFVGGDDECSRVDLTALGANTRPLPGPPNALTPELAAMVVSGKMTPEEAHFLVHDRTECCTSSSREDDMGDDESDSGDESDSDSDEDDDGDESGSDDESDFSLDEEEMADILNTLTLPPSGAQ